MSGATRESLGILLSGTAGIAFLAGFMPSLLTTVLGWLFFGIMIIGVLLSSIAMRRQGVPVGTIILIISLFGGISFLVVYGFMWYFVAYLPASGAFSTFGDFLSSTPRPTSR